MQTFFKMLVLDTITRKERSQKVFVARPSLFRNYQSELRSDLRNNYICSLKAIRKRRYKLRRLDGKPALFEDYLLNYLSYIELNGRNEIEPS